MDYKDEWLLLEADDDIDEMEHRGAHRGIFILPGCGQRRRRAGKEKL